jgi:hypothetical protein
LSAAACPAAPFGGEFIEKYQIPILNDQNRFGIWNFADCDLFDICDL